MNVVKSHPVGLFIGSGSALATGGPLALMIGFGLVGAMLFFVIHALGELAVTFPIEGIRIYFPISPWQVPFPSIQHGSSILPGALPWAGITLWDGWSFFPLN